MSLLALLAYVVAPPPHTRPDKPRVPNEHVCRGICWGEQAPRPVFLNPPAVQRQTADMDRRPRGRPL